MEISTLENWLWDAACAIRGPLVAPQLKDYILPLLFFKRLSDVYEDELGRLPVESFPQLAAWREYISGRYPWVKDYALNES